MATERQQYKIACVGLDEANKRPIVSAIGVTSSRLGAEFEWSSPALADICIVDISQADAASVTAAVIRYTPRQNGREVDLVRPVRVGQLLSALKVAMLEADQQRASRPATGRPRRYRGQIIEDRPQTENAQKPDAAPATGRTIVYRGVRIQT